MRLSGALYELDADEPRADRELPGDADGCCAECGEPGALVEGLCEVCRCAGCGDPGAPVEHHGHRLCHACAVDAGWIEPLTWRAAE